MFGFKPHKLTAKTFKGIGQLAKRFKVLRDLAPWYAAEIVREAVAAKVPVTPEWRPYREGFETVRIGGPRKPTFAVVVSGNKSSQIKKIDAPVTLIHVRALRRMVRPAPSIQILERYSPWTMDTLPFMPTKREATVTSKRTTKQVALRVSKQRKQDRIFWAKDLEKAGRKETHKKDRPKTTPRTAKPVSDLQGHALRLEFGLGIKAVPHWRPALLPFIRDRNEIFRRRPELLDIFNLKFRHWKSMKSHPRKRISRADAKRFSPFAAKLGL